MMIKNFKFKEFLVNQKEEVPHDVVDKIVNYHMIPAQLMRDYLGFPLIISQHSCYRSKNWELKQGRSGTSQHTFLGKGACDYTVKNFQENKEKLLDAILQCTDYNRISLYNSFIHCDYASGGDRVFYKNTKSGWQKLTYKEFIKLF